MTVGYGVRPLWLLYWFASFVALGTVVFMQRGATYREPLSPHHLGEKQRNLGFRDAFWVSLSAFLPVSIPAGGGRKPSSGAFMRVGFTIWWTVLRLAGWVLVPVAIAALSGLLLRR
jgi:hypothetical protein